MIDLYTHTLFSDGELVPAELVRRADRMGYRWLAITDHVDSSTLEHAIRGAVAVTAEVARYWKIRVLPGAELTHNPPDLLPELIREARRMGARVVVVHGETLVEPVPEGTNTMAIAGGCDILAHPGLITAGEARRAARRGVALELSARKGHCLANGHVGLNGLNTMNLLYGQTRREEQDSNGDRNWGDAEKSADQVDIEALFRLTKGWAVDPYFSLRWESFFQDVTDPFGRELWFNPMTFKESGGVARTFIDNDRQKFVTRFGVTAREMTRAFFVAPTGDETQRESSWDSGAELVIDHVIHFNPTLTYVSRTSFYQPFNWSKWRRPW